jgi:hypothetical protein
MATRRVSAIQHSALKNHNSFLVIPNRREEPIQKSSAAGGFHNLKLKTHHSKIIPSED